MTTSVSARSGVAGAALAAALAFGLVAAPAAPLTARAPAPAAASPVRVAHGGGQPIAADAQPSQAVTLSTGEGQLIQLPRAISDVFVADEKVADVQPRTPTRLYLFGKNAGQTTVSATDKSGAVVWQANVRVGNNMAGLQQMLKVTMPEAQVVATPMNGLVVLTGTVAAPDDVEEASRLVQAFVGKDVTVVTRIKTATPLQVMLKVRFAEINRALSKQIGVNFLTRDPGGSNSIGGGASQGKDIGSISPYKDPNSGIVNNAISQFVLNNINGPGSRFGIAGHLLGLDVLAAIDLAETDGYATTLAQPTLTAISGETASFLAGGEIPIPVPQFQGVTTVEYKQYGVSLAFTPTVLGENRISLRVRPEVSQLTNATTLRIGGYSVPGLTTRRAETTVELGSGQSFVIGGLLSNDASNSVDKAPFLGDLPIVGLLFRSNSWKRNESELVIVVTPYLVKPVSDGRIALPTDGYRQPTDLGTLSLDQQMAGSRSSRRVKPRAEAPVNAPAPAAGTPVAGAALASGRRGKDAGGAAPGFSFN